MESIVSKLPAPTKEQIEQLAAIRAAEAEMDPRVEVLVNELIGRVADKWTMIILDVLAEHGELRFTRLGKLVTGISQKMLTQTLRAMERDGLLTRTVHASVPPRVDYKLTELGAGLGMAFCGVWVWAMENIGRVETMRRAFDDRQRAAKAKFPALLDGAK
jgi:DNA-binding HxlR family transcriptional regulator